MTIMENREFATYGYELGNHTKGLLILVVIISAILAIACGAGYSPWFFFLLIVPAGLAFHIYRAGYDKTLMIANRYVILGDRIMYFRNVTRVSLDKEKQILTLTSDRGKNLVISASKFPTNARKDFKIQANRTAKFRKVADRLIARLRETSPDIVIS